MNLGIFESLAADQTESRLASRKALLAAQSRIDKTFGKFLKSGSVEDFQARYSLVADDFAAIVNKAATECKANSEPLLKVLYDHYKTACSKCGCSDCDSDGGCSCGDCPGCDSKKESAREAAPLDGRLAGDKGSCSECGQEGFLKGGVCGPCRGKKLHDDDNKHIDIKDDDGDSDDDGGETLDFTARTAEDGNTDLDGPEPKMDKQRWTPDSVKEIDVPSDVHPTKSKDVMEVMEKKNLTGPAHSMEETGSAKEEKLPSAAEDSDDSGFADGGVEKGPKTKTFGDKGQTKPVTKETLEKDSGLRWSHVVVAWGEMSEGEQYGHEMADQGRDIPHSGFGGDPNRDSEAMAGEPPRQPREQRMEMAVAEAQQAPDMESAIRVMEGHGFSRGESYELLQGARPQAGGGEPMQIPKQVQRGYPAEGEEPIPF